MLTMEHLKEDIDQIRSEHHRLDEEQRRMKDDIVELKTNYVHTNVSLATLADKLNSNSNLVRATLVAVVVSLATYIIKGGLFS